MKTIYDVRQLLKRFGTYIYTGNKVADLDLMQAELKDLQAYNMIWPEDYAKAILLLMQEKTRLNEVKEREK